MNRKQPNRSRKRRSKRSSGSSRGIKKYRKRSQRRVNKSVRNSRMKSRMKSRRKSRRKSRKRPSRKKSVMKFSKKSIASRRRRSIGKVVSYKVPIKSKVLKQPLTIYTAPGCPACTDAKKLCDEKGIKYVSLNRSEHSEDVKKRTGNCRYVPNIFNNDGSYVGGNDICA